jgi:hypothetical protein
MPLRSHFSNGYGKAVAILEYQGINESYVPNQDYKYRASAVIDEETGKSMEYRDLLKDPKHREIWSRAALPSLVVDVKPVFIPSAKTT